MRLEINEQEAELLFVGLTTLASRLLDDGARLPREDKLALSQLLLGRLLEGHDVMPAGTTNSDALAMTVKLLNQFMEKRSA